MRRWSVSPNRYCTIATTCSMALPSPRSGEVKSVLLAHRRPLEEIQVVYADPASLASVQLLRVLLAEMGLFPEWKPLPSYDIGGLAGLRDADWRPGAQVPAGAP